MARPKGKGAIAFVEAEINFLRCMKLIRKQEPGAWAEGLQEEYKEKFWNGSGAHRLSWPLCLAHFDCAVTLGNGLARQILIKSQGDFEKYNEDRRQLCRQLPAFRHFGRMWLARIRAVEEEGKRSDVQAHELKRR